MKIEWNRVTWYSKLIAVILFLVTFALAFCFGMQYQSLKESGQLLDYTSNTVPGSVTLGMGRSGKIGGLIFTVNAVVQDSRCAVDVVCIQAGSVTVNVTLSSGEKSITKDLRSDGPSYEFEKYKISISDVSPPRYSQKEIRSSDYHITFRVEK